MRTRDIVGLILIVLTLNAACCPEAKAAKGILGRSVVRGRSPLRLLSRHRMRRILQGTAESANSELAAIHRAIEEGYGKLDHLSMVCFGYAATLRDGKPNSSLYYGGMAYGYDRKTARLAIFKDGRPEILVQNGHLFTYLWGDSSGTATYLESVKPRSITWNDVDEAERIVAEQCPLAGYAHVDRCMVLPLLEGGIDRLFAGTIQILRQSDTREQVNIFELGHPQWKVMIGLPQPVAKLDPARYPRCFRVKNGSTNLSYAIDSSGMISAVVGIVSRVDVLSVPGNRLFVLKKNCGLVEKGQTLGSENEFLLELPQGAKRIGAADLKASYRAEMKAEGMEILQAELDNLEKGWKELLTTEAGLLAKIADCQTNGQKRDELARFRAEFDEVQGEKKSYESVAPRLRELIDDLKKTELKW